MKRRFIKGFNLLVVLAVLIGHMPVVAMAENNIYSEKKEAQFMCSEKNELSEPIQTSGTEGDYEYADIDGGVSIVKYSGCSENVVIPSTIAGKQVIEIGDDAFSECNDIISVVVPDGIKKIGASTFFFCANLKNVDLPNSLIGIGANSFENCTNLTSINIPKSIKTISFGAFEYCYELKRIDIPEGVTRIERRAFNGCSSLNEVELPESIGYIGAGAFYNCPITHFNISKNVSILESAFSSCTNLISIDVSADNQNYKSIDGLVYNKSCTELVACPGGAVTINIPSTVTSIDDGACYGSVQLTSINLPESLLNIGEAAFSCCPNVTNLSIPEAVKKIGSEAFAQTGITSINIPKNVSTIGKDPFFFCEYLMSIDVSADNRNYKSIDGVLYDKKGEVLITCPRGVSSVNIPEGVKAIDEKAFEYCKKLINVEFPNSLRSIRSAAFFDCENLTRIAFPEGIISIGDASFLCCERLASVSFPKSVNYISEDAFDNCPLLDSIHGAKGSYVEAYAKEYDFHFIADLIPGKDSKWIDPYYRSHIQNMGWEDWRNNRAQSGTFFQNLRLEGIEIKLDQQGYDIGVEYSTHVQNIGWQDFVKDGAMSGTEGQSLRIEAIEIRLTGSDADKFDIYYQVNVQDWGRLGIAKNGELAGTAGYGYRLEGIRIALVPVGEPAPDWGWTASKEDAFYENPR